MSDRAEMKAQKEAEKERQKINKKRAKFLDPSSNLSTRSKALLGYVELEHSEAVGATFHDHHELVFSSFIDTVNFAEANSRKGESACRKDKESGSACPFF
jgi:hypothetical protein